MIAMIEATLRTVSVSATGGRDGAAAAGGATPARAVRVAPIAGDTDREDAMTATAGFLAERNVHGVGAAVRSDWTYSPNRGTTDRTASARRSPRQSPRVRRISPGPHPQLAQPTRSRVHATATRPWTLPDPWTRGRAHRSLQNRADAVSHKRPPPSSFSDHKTGSERPGERSPDFYASTWLPTKQLELARWLRQTLGLDNAAPVVSKALKGTVVRVWGVGRLRLSWFFRGDARREGARESLLVTAVRSVIRKELSRRPHLTTAALAAVVRRELGLAISDEGVRRHRHTMGLTARQTRGRQGQTT